MPVQLASYLVPKNGGAFFLMEDIYLKGGYRIVADVAARDAINSPCLKNGMMVYCIAEDKHYRYNLATTSWVETALGSVGPVGPTGPAGTFSGTYTGDGGVTGKWSYNNTYANLASFPSASGKAGTVVVAADTGFSYYSNGTDWVTMALIYDIALNVYGTANVANGTLATFLAPRKIVILQGASGVAMCETAPAGAVTLPIKMSGAQIGTVTFAAGATSGTVSITNQATLNVGTMLSISNQATPDTAIKNISITIKASAV